MASRIIVASAGSGKTTHLVELAMSEPQKRVLVTTYTNENTDNIRNSFVARLGYIPANINLVTWYSFLITHGVRPYHNLMANVALARSPALLDLPPQARFIPKSDVDAYFFSANGHLYRDRVSELVCLLDERTGGLVLERLRSIYDWLFIDELQDLNGYDLELLERILRSGPELIGVCDPRQCTFITNQSNKNSGLARAKVMKWFEMMQKQGLLTIEERNGSHRCNQEICDFADQLYPDFPKSTSLNTHVTGHDGIVTIPRSEAVGYFETYGPAVLRWDKRANTEGLPAMNIGRSKGRTYDRVLIFPTAPMTKYLATGDLSQAGDLSKFYVAVTRARYSVAFVT